MTRFEELVAGSQSKILELLKNKESLPDYMLEGQLNLILKELDQMALVKDASVFYPYYPKGIADSWDFNDKLAAELLEVLDVYRRLRK